MAVCTKINEIMDWHGIKQIHLSKLTGIPQSTLSRYLNSDDDLPFSALPKIADALGVSLWALLNGEPMLVQSDNLTQEERELVDGCRHLDPEMRKAVRDVIKAGRPKR